MFDSRSGAALGDLVAEGLAQVLDSNAATCIPPTAQHKEKLRCVRGVDDQLRQDFKIATSISLSG